MKVEAPFIHLIKLHTKYYLYDVNSKMIVNISNDLFDFFKSNENIKAEIEIPHKLEDEVRRLLKYDLFSKTDTGYEIEYPQGTNLEEILNNCMRIMTLQVTQNCNLRCKYCVYSGSYSNRVHSNKRMSFETAKSAIDFLYAHSSMTTSIGIVLEHVHVIVRQVHAEEQYADKLFSCTFAFFPNFFIFFTSSSINLWS